MEDFEVDYVASKIDGNTVLVTSDTDYETAEQIASDILKEELAELRTYNKKKIDMSTVVTADNMSKDKLSLGYIDDLADGLNSDRSKQQIANALIRKYILAEGLLGRTQEIIVANSPKAFTLTYGKLERDESRRKELEEVRFVIESFNNDIDIKGLIQDCISTVFLEGNFQMTLRLKDGNSAIIDHYPSTFCYPSGYKSRGFDVLEFDLTQLRGKLQKYYKRNRKNKAIYYEKMKDEIRANYPVEIYTAFCNGEQYARLNSKYSCSVKINDLGRNFGVSPYFKCLKYLYMLNSLEEADASDATARSKKIIFQKLRKELMGNDGNRKGLTEQKHAHESAAKALKTNFCLYTAPPYVESLEYVVPKVSGMAEDNKDQNNIYTSKLLQSLGISFVDGSASVGVAKLSVQALLRTIDSITSKLARCIHHFYEAVLEDNGYDRSLAPEIIIESAEKSDISIRMELASFLYNTLNCSRSTAYELVGYNIHNEASLRMDEDERGYEDLFIPHMTSYTFNGSTGVENPSGTSSPGRPQSSDNEAKKEYDREYYYDGKGNSV